MKKGTSIVLLSILSVIMAFVLVMTFVRFPVGTNKNYNSLLGAIELDHGISESTVYTLELDPLTVAPSDSEMEELMGVLSFRLSELGFENHSIKAVKNAKSNVYDIRIELNANLDKYYEPDNETLTSIVNTAVKYGELKFFSGTSASSITNELFTNIDPIKSAKAMPYNEYTGGYGVEIVFTDEAYEKMQELMNSGDFFLKITFGEDTLLESSNALTESYFANQGITFTTASEDAAKQLVLQITSGGFGYKYNVSSPAIVNPYLGDNAATLSVVTIGAILLVAMVALILINKGFGIASALSLVAFALLEVSMLILIPGIKLSIGGILGILFASILAIDGMIITAKRVREELQSGKTVKSAIRAGFKRALLPNLNACVVTAITSLLLFIFTSAEVKLFAITFGIGSVLAGVASLVFARMFIALLLPIVKNKEKFLNAKKEEA